MRTSFLRFIKEHSLFTAEDKLLLGISGGLDSVCLLNLLLATGYTPALAHVNFKLRATESDQDAEFVEHLAQENNLAYFVAELDAAKFAKERKVSIQMAARELRYNWFRQLCQQHNYTKVLLAHHTADRTETLLLNVSRGTGLPGLKGIPVQHTVYARPLMFADRKRIQAYAERHQLSWREDSSNQKDTYKRNFIRHKIIPGLKQLNPELDKAISTATEQAASAEKLVLWFINKHKNLKLTDSADTKIDLQLLLSLPEPELILYYLLKEFDFKWGQVKSIMSVYLEADTASGKVFTSAKSQAFLNRNHLIIPANWPTAPEAEALLKLPQTEAGPYLWHICYLPASNYVLKPLPNVAALDADLVGNDILVRPWREGDRFVPLGMRGSKKISDFMIDQKIALNLKSRVWVACNNRDIIWLAGWRPDNRYKITPTTKTVLEIRQMPL